LPITILEYERLGGVCYRNGLLVRLNVNSLVGRLNWLIIGIIVIIGIVEWVKKDVIIGMSVPGRTNQPTSSAVPE
jgi:hypothetical protein